MFDKKGFTLIELIVVLIIIAILSAIAIPNYITYTQQGAAKAAQNNLITIYGAQKNYYLSNGSYCVAGCDNLSDINLPANLNLNIADNYFTNYSCTAVNGFTCTATSPSISGFSLAITGGAADNPAPIVLPGGTGTLNPSCNPANSIYCPN